MGTENLSPKVRRASRHVRRGEKPGDKPVFRSKRTGQGVSRVTKGKDLLTGIQYDRRTPLPERGQTVCVESPLNGEQIEKFGIIISEMKQQS